MSSTATRRRQNTTVKIVAAVIGVPVIIGLMLFAFLAPNFSSGPQGVPIAVAGPEQMVKHMTDKAGEGGPDLRVYESDADVRDAIENRDVVGGLVITPSGAQTYTASGNGAAYTEMVNQLGKSFEAQGMEVATEDLAPTSEEDPQANGIGLLGLPLAFGGIVSAVIATFVFRRRKWVKFVVLVGIAAGGSLVATWMLHTVYGTLIGKFGMEWLAIALGILSTSLLTAGLAAVIGTAGVGIGAVLTIFLGNPLSGLATGPWLLPDGWATLGQWMPIGATGYLVRSLSYFDGQGVGHAWWVFAVWIAVGFALLMWDRSASTTESKAGQAG